MNYRDIFLSALSVGAALLLSSSPIGAQAQPGSRDTSRGSEPSTGMETSRDKGSSVTQSQGSQSGTSQWQGSSQRSAGESATGGQVQGSGQGSAAGSLGGSAQGSSQSPTYGETETRGTRIAGGMAKEDVKKAQQALKEKGHDPGPVDGIIGPRTQAALKAFQQAQGLNASGQLNDETKQALGLEQGMGETTGGMGGRTSRGGGSSSAGQETHEQSAGPEGKGRQ
ncbi:MAG: peptidoglycan-binding protein [Deltaproteobacteria bacterium]|nr:peptidoglycan-binding protein [Deltaproteobacteria bacterium]